MNKTIDDMFSYHEPSINQTEMPSGFATAGKERLMIDVETPQGSNATMERIHRANREKKQAKKDRVAR